MEARLPLALAQKGYVMETGRIVLEGPASDLRENDKVQHTYLCVAWAKPVATSTALGRKP